MNIHHPEIKKQISDWQNELRKRTNQNVILLAFEPEVKIPFEVLKEIICKATGVPFQKAISHSRKGPLALTRQIISYYARTHYKLKLEEVATDLGGQDHTTVINSVKRVKGLIEFGDETVCNVIAKINVGIEAYKQKNQQHEQRKLA